MWLASWWKIRRSQFSFNILIYLLQKLVDLHKLIPNKLCTIELRLQRLFEKFITYRLVRSFFKTISSNFIILSFSWFWWKLTSEDSWLICCCKSVIFISTCSFSDFTGYWPYLLYYFWYLMFRITCVMLQQYWKSTWFCSVAKPRWTLSSSSCCRNSVIHSSVSRVRSSTTWLCFRMLPTSVIRCRRCRISSLSTERIVDMSCSRTWTRWSVCWSKRSMLTLRRCILCWCFPRGHSFKWDRIRMRGMNTLQLFGHSSSTCPQCMRCSYIIVKRKFLWIEFIDIILKSFNTP